MTAVRSRAGAGWSEESLVIADPDGDTLVVDRLVGNDPGDRVLITGDGAVRVGLDDGLALLSFLADSLGVERFVPGDGAS